MSKKDTNILVMNRGKEEERPISNTYKERLAMKVKHLVMDNTQKSLSCESAFRVETRPSSYDNPIRFFLEALMCRKKPK